jgi:hypothetical protein
MAEPRELADARRRLAAADAQYRTQHGLAQLVEGLALLDDLIAEGKAPHAQTATNVATTYASRIYERIRKKVEQDAGVPEPELEHFFKVVLAFDTVGSVLPPASKALKVAVVRQLIERYYEGHPPEHKRQALESLAQLSGED